MENTQSVQQKPTQTTRTTPALTDSKLSGVNSSQIMINLLVRHPWILLIGLLTLFVGSATLAVYSLGYVGYVGQPEEPEQIPEPSTVFEEASNTPSQISNPIPLWMVAAITLSCASGCLIILRWINQPKERQKLPQSVKRYQPPVVKSRQHRLERQTPRNLPNFAPTASVQPLVSIQPPTKPLTTVLPLEQRHQLNNSQESLVDLLDLRKQNTMSSILRKY